MYVFSMLSGTLTHIRKDVEISQVVRQLLVVVYTSVAGQFCWRINCVLQSGGAFIVLLFYEF